MPQDASHGHRASPLVRDPRVPDPRVRDQSLHLKVVRAILGVLSVVCALLAVMFLLVNWDPTRIAYKRWLADDPYQYDEIDPRYRAIDPATRITVASSQQAEERRRALIATIWSDGNLPLRARPARIETIDPAADGGGASRSCDPSPGRSHVRVRCVLERYAGLANLHSMEHVHIPVGDFVAIATLFRPITANDRLILFHNGLASTINRQYRHIATWISLGYSVLAFNMPGFGEFGGTVPDYETAPLRVFVEPVIVGLNDAVARFDVKTVDMVGFSAGGWVTVIAAAVDPRIRRSYPVAASLPVFLRRDRETAHPQLRDDLLSEAGYLDMYVLGSVGKGRGQVQIFNRYDTCCFAGTRALLYEPAVRQVVAAIGDGSGSFDVVIDETHPRHKISRFAMEVIATDMMRP